MNLTQELILRDAAFADAGWQPSRHHARRWLPQRLTVADRPRTFTDQHQGAHHD
jgi:hypothetical protein